MSLPRILVPLLWLLLAASVVLTINGRPFVYASPVVMVAAGLMWLTRFGDRKRTGELAIAAACASVILFSFVQ